MNTLIPNNALMVENGRALTSSLKIAEVFGKHHKDILRAVRSLKVSTTFLERNFAPMFREVNFGNGSTRKETFYNITKDGFVMLVMGFIGEKAAAFKEAYIEAFNEMEAKLKSQSALPPPPPPPPKNPIAYLCSPGEYEAHIKMSVKDIPPKADQLSAYSLLDILDGLGYPVERALVEIALMHHYTVYMRGMSEVLELRLLPSLLESLKARDKLYAIGDFKNGTSDIRSGMSFQD